MNKQIIVIFILAVFLSSCENNLEDSYGSSTQIKKVLDESNSLIGQYKYHRSGLIKSYTYQLYSFMPGYIEEMEYSYDTQNIIVGKSGYTPGNPLMSSLLGAMGKGVSIAYSYNKNNQLSKVSTQFDYGEYENINSSFEQEFEYFGDSLVVLSSTDSNSPEAFVSFIEYTISKGNIIKEIQYSLDENEDKRIYTLTTYTHDDKHNPFQFEPTPTSKNNVTQKNVIYFYHDYETGETTEQDPSIYTYEYTYNEHGFPTSETETWPNESIHIRYFKY